MIRRDCRDAAAAPSWMLISQVEHARLAGTLAEQWGRQPFAPLAPRREVLAAVYAHDDGWAEWECLPQVDTSSGRPLDFTEMPLADSLAIWRGSIASAARIGPLAAWLVSGHFSVLLQRFSSRWQSDAGLAGLAQGYLNEQTSLRTSWLAEWQSTAPAECSLALAQTALGHLQMFDRISLWLCCAVRTEPHDEEVPGGLPLRFRPQSPEHIVVEPWPWQFERLELAVAGRIVPAEPYSSAAALAAVEGARMTVEWVLSRA